MRAYWFSLITVFAVAAVIYVAGLTPYIGGGYDDSAYIALAKALASGKGYGQIYAPGNPPEPQYPPGWPAMLSIVWLINPDFPANAVGFKIVSVICALAFVAVTFGWMRWRGESMLLSTLVVALTLSNPLIFGTASTAFSEMAYACFSILALWLIERYARIDRTPWFDVVLASLAAAFTAYIRMFGVTMVLAGISFLFMRTDKRRAMTFGLLSLLLIAPWFVRGLFLPSGETGYSQQFLLRSMEQPELGYIGLGDLVARVVLNLRAYLLAGLPGAVLPSQVPLTYVNLTDELRLGVPFPGSDIVLAALMAAAILGPLLLRRDLVDWFVALYLGLALLWPWEPTRFVVPLIPLLYGYLLTEIKLFGSAVVRHLSWADGLRWLAVGAVTLFIVANFVLQARLVAMLWQSDTPAEWAARFRLYDWIKYNTAEKSVLASLNDTELYLYTGRTVVRNTSSRDIVMRFAVDYVVLIPYGGVMVEGDLARMQFGQLYRSNSSAFDRVYNDDSAGIEVFRVTRELSAH